MGFMKRMKSEMPTADEALPVRSQAMVVPERHFVNGHRLQPPFPDGTRIAMFGLGCFWGAEKRFWDLPGVYSTSVGYAGGLTPNPTYEEVCTGLTGHNEVVRVVFDPAQISWRQAARDVSGSRTMTAGACARQRHRHAVPFGIYWYDEVERAAAERSREVFSGRARRFAPITTEIVAAPTFYYAEDYHQQYLAKNPAGYCGLGGTGVSCPVGCCGRQRVALTFSLGRRAPGDGSLPLGTWSRTPSPEPVPSSRSTAAPGAAALWSVVQLP